MEVFLSAYRSLLISLYAIKFSSTFLGIVVFYLAFLIGSVNLVGWSYDGPVHILVGRDTDEGGFSLLNGAECLPKRFLMTDS